MSCELSEMSLDYVLIRTYFNNIHFEPHCIGKMVRWNGDAAQIGTAFAVDRPEVSKGDLGFVFLTVSTASS